MTAGTAILARLRRRVAFARDRRRLERDFTRLIAASFGRPPARDGGPVVGVATFGSGGWHFVLEALLAHALAWRGARPEMLICDLPGLPICDERTIHSRDPDRCAGCLGDKRTLVDVSGLPWRGVSTLVSAGALERARVAVSTLDPEEFAAYEQRGWPIGRWLHVSASHFLRCDARGDAPEKIEARRRLLTSAMVIVEAVERWLDELRPDIVIAESGAHFMWRIAMEMARARGIPVVCREIGKGGWDTHIYALDADCMSPDLAVAWSEARDQTLSVAEQAEVERFLEQLPEKAYLQRTPLTSTPSAQLRTQLGVPPGRKVAVAFTNVTWDLATAGRDAGFTGVFDWVSETMRLLAAFPDVQLIVRAHPAEASVQTREHILDQMAQAFPDRPRGVTFVAPEQPIAARDLCSMADLVLVYNSSVGLEAAAYGHTVVVCGRPHYRDKGFTYDVSSRAEYRRWLSQWASGEPIHRCGGWAELARRYAHLFFLRYHVPMGWTTSPLEPPYHLTLRSLDELRPGRNRSVDAVCDGILERRQILLPRRPIV